MVVPAKLPHRGLKQHICNERVEVAAREQKTWQSRGFRSLDIGCTVTDYKTAITLHGPMLHKVMDHARAWLSPMMVLEIANNRSCGVMRAVSDIVDDSILRRKFCAHPLM